MKHGLVQFAWIEEFTRNKRVKDLGLRKGKLDEKYLDQIYSHVTVLNLAHSFMKSNIQKK